MAKCNGNVRDDKIEGGMKGKQDKTFNRARTKSAAGDLFKFSKKKIWALEFRQ